MKRLSVYFVLKNFSDRCGGRADNVTLYILWACTKNIQLSLIKLKISLIYNELKVKSNTFFTYDFVVPNIWDVTSEHNFRFSYEQITAERSYKRESLINRYWAQNSCQTISERSLITFLFYPIAPQGFHHYINTGWLRAVYSDVYLQQRSAVNDPLMIVLVCLLSREPLELSTYPRDRSQ